MTHTGLEIRRISQDLEGLLADMFRKIKQSGEDKHFHPHPFDDETAHMIANHGGKDLFYAVAGGEKILGYGMLRGWDAGYEIPSLGIIILKEARGTGLGKTLMYFLHAAARHRGSSRIRLKVYPDNKAAVNLYKELGYVFDNEEDGQLVGIIEL